jgi:hypothetical protein
MTYLTTGIDSKAHASREPIPAGCASRYRSEGEGMSAFTNSAWTRDGMPFLAIHAHSPTSFSRFQTLPQVMP